MKVYSIRMIGLIAFSIASSSPAADRAKSKDCKERLTKKLDWAPLPQAAREFCADPALASREEAVIKCTLVLSSFVGGGQTQLRTKAQAFRACVKDESLVKSTVALYEEFHDSSEEQTDSLASQGTAQRR